MCKEYAEAVIAAARKNWEALTRTGALDPTTRRRTSFYWAFEQVLRELTEEQKSELLAIGTTYRVEPDLKFWEESSRDNPDLHFLAILKFCNDIRPPRLIL